MASEAEDHGNGDAALNMFVADEMYTINDVAQRLRVSLRQVQRWCYDGWIRSIRLPSGRRLLGTDLNAFINERLVERTDEPVAEAAPQSGRARTRRTHPPTGQRVA
jgi:excisionase family DNA binding protein